MKKPRAVAARPTYDSSVLGSTGLRQTGGYINEEFLKELVGSRGATVYREMSDNDPIVGAVLFAVTTLLREAEWTVQAVDDSPEAEAAKTFVEECISDMEQPFSSVIDEACSMFTYGFAPMEILWKRRIGPDTTDPASFSAYSDGKIGLRGIALRAQPTVFRWDIDEATGAILGFWQQPWTGPQVHVPAEKMLLFRTTRARNNPEGRSILRTAYRPYYFKRRLQEIEAIGVERDLAGFPVAYVPGRLFEKGAEPADRQVLANWQTMITSIRRDQAEGLVIPSTRDKDGNLLFDLKLLSTGGSRTFDTSKIIDRYDRAIATSVLADFIFLGQQAVGSFALSSDKTALFATAFGGFLKGSIADVLNRDLLPRLWTLNGFDREFMPRLVPSDLESQNIAELADFIQKLTSSGATMFPDRELENHLRRAAGLPPAPEEGTDFDPAAEAEERARRGAAQAGVADPAAEGDTGAGGASQGEEEA